jgi:hypothetical protein
MREASSNSLAHPAALGFDSLPAFANSSVALQSITWGRSALSAGDFEQLERLLSSGWKQHRLQSALETGVVEITSTQPHGGKSALRMAVKGSAISSVHEPTVSIQSGPLTVKAGQIARVHGWARVPANAAGQSAELLVYDNQAGIELAERLRNSREWREFTLFRAVPSDGEFKLHFALVGSGEIYLDDVTLDFSPPPGATKVP